MTTHSITRRTALAASALAVPSLSFGQSGWPKQSISPVSALTPLTP